jgi:hypothetical protein
MLFGQIFVYYYIIKASPRLMLYRLKDKRGSGALGRLIALKLYSYCRISICVSLIIVLLGPTKKFKHLQFATYHSNIYIKKINSFT